MPTEHEEGEGLLTAIDFIEDTRGGADGRKKTRLDRVVPTPCAN